MTIKLHTFSKIIKSINPDRSQLLEAVRGLAIIWITWYHIDSLMLPTNQDIWNIRTLARLGFSGVNVFLFMSGFGLTLSMTKAHLNFNHLWIKLPWKKFFIRRFFKIYPLYIFCHFLFFITGIIMGKYADMPLDIGFLLSVTGLKVFFPKYFWYGPDAFWFIGLIIQLYILFPILFWLLLKTGKINFFIIVFIICTISRLITANSEYYYVLILGLAPNRLSEFCLGMLVGYTTATNKDMNINKISLVNKHIWLVFVLAVLVGLLINVQPILSIRIVCYDLVLAIASFTGLTIIALFISYISSAYNALFFLGNISYTFYLLHSPPIRPVFAILRNIGIQNFCILIVIFLSIITLFSFALTYLESLILPVRRND